MHESTRTQGLRLATHVRACRVDGRVILLDLLHNRYLGIDAAASNVLTDDVDGWPVAPAGNHPCAPGTSVTALIQRLAKQGLLSYAAGEQQQPTSIEVPTASLSFGHAGTVVVGPGRFGRFVRCAAVAAWWLRWRTLQSIAEAITTRRARVDRCARASWSVDAMTDGAAAFDRLRPFVFSAQDRCLHDSLSMVGFLATEGAFPHWVIGVKTRPFGAHSWVQCGAAVLNDHHENVRRYTPILVV